MTDLRDRLRSHLKREGFLIPSNHELIRRRLRTRMGAERYEAYCTDADKMRARVIGIDTIYRAVQTQEEAHLLFSHQAELILESGVWLTRKLSETNLDPHRIADLGCATGTLSRWLGGRFTASQVFGFEREETLLDIACGIPGSAKFLRWNYGEVTEPPESGFDALVSSLGIDFPECDGQVPIGFENYRDLDYCRRIHQFAQPIFRNWRSLATEGAVLLAVLRIPYLGVLFGLVDAATDAGWSLDLIGSDFVTVEQERLPALSFTARTGQAHEENFLIGFWLEEKLYFSRDQLLKDDVALAFYRSLAPKEVIATEQIRFDDGHTARCTVAKCGPIAIQFTEATTGYARLALHALHKADQLKPVFLKD